MYLCTTILFYKPLNQLVEQKSISVQLYITNSMLFITLKVSLDLDFLMSSLLTKNYNV